jgi:CDP-4-dehydro-6-deoxyglucose reductase
MASKITVRPSGHVFESEPSETLLQAGLRAGLNLDHSCANGTCGECRARRVRGDVEVVSHFDYRFSDVEKQLGWFLMCSCRARGDVEIEAHESGSAADIPQQLLRAKVSRIEQLQQAVMQLTIRTPRSSGLHFLAGQNVRVTFADVESRVLAIASCPCDSIQLRFHIRRRADDPFSTFVFEGLRKGCEVLLEGPCGDFTLDEESERPLVFIAWESGFAAVSSLVDHVLQKNENRSIDLYWLSEIPDGHYLSNYCRAWRDVLDDFRYHFIDLQPSGNEVMTDVLDRIIRVHALLADHDYYLALPQQALQEALLMLQAADVPSKQIRASAMQHP